MNQVVQCEGGDGVRGGGVDLMVGEEALLLVQQIATNLVSYCRVAMTIGGEVANVAGCLSRKCVSICK